MLRDVAVLAACVSIYTVLGVTCSGLEGLLKPAADHVAQRGQELLASNLVNYILINACEMIWPLLQYMVGAWDNYSYYSFSPLPAQLRYDEMHLPPQHGIDRIDCLSSPQLSLVSV